VGDDIEISVSLPLDTDGFLRRECPHCMHEFKWHNGPASDEAEQHAAPPAYHCPLCGQPAGMESWYTQVQVEYLDQSAAPIIDDVVGSAMDDLLKGFSGTKGITISRSGGRRVHSPNPDPLVEPDDMTIVASPCHSYEPVKVADNHVGPLYCLVCGSAYAV
jgi:hypothetical protein